MKYIIKFKKEGKIRFISHLDLQKVFLRLFRIIGVKPKYSNGFNPHPKLSFALPLSLGFASKAEYLEIETENEKGFDINQVLSKLTYHLPSGLTIEYIRQKPDKINKKLAAYIDCAEYEIICPAFLKPKDNIKKFISQKKIVYDKVSRKSGKVKEVDIKPSVLKLNLESVDNNNITLSSLLHAGNDSVLNPNVLIENLYSFIGEPVDLNSLIITRKNVFCRIEDNIMNVDDIF